MLIWARNVNLPPFTFFEETALLSGGFPGGIVVKYPLANVGDTGDASSIPK